MKLEKHVDFSAKCLLIIIILSMAAGCGVTQQTVPEQQPTPKPTPKKPKPQIKQAPLINPQNIPKTPREMRGVWIATVSNIDWPSKPGLPVSQQKAELRALFDRAAELNMNAVFLQVRPAADALYDSPYEPWSEYLTGKQGKPPQPFYDPLQFAIEEAHKRGLELHAWFNPFRARHSSAESELAPTHIKNIKPDWVVSYGNYLWLNPGLPAARNYSEKVILDVVRRYNIDGVHLDDYFYPYPVRTASNNFKSFPDEQAYRNYVQKNGAINRDDWRRQNINRFVEQLHNELHQVKPNIVFGISPFGIWRPGSPAQIEGFDAYANIFADARKWLNEGWVDYLSPQLYWPINQHAQSFPVLLDWWQQQNKYGRHLWPGLYTSKVGGSWSAREIIQQIERTRHQKGTSGHVHFSMQALMNNSGNISEYLRSIQYNKPALVPATPWLADKHPPQPRATIQQIDNQLVITFPPNELTKPWRVIIKTKYGNNWETEIHPGWRQTIAIPVQNEQGTFAGVVISVVNKQNVESAGQILLPAAIQISSTE